MLYCKYRIFRGENMDFESVWPNEKRDFKYIPNGSIENIELFNSDNLEMEFYSYSVKFNSAANELLKNMILNQRINILDTWYFPLVYLYRQSLELILKSISFKYILSKEDRKGFIEKVRHSLFECFKEIYVFLDKDNSIINSKEVNWLFAYLENISDIDAQSDLFRYPFNNQGMKYFEKQTHLNLKALYYNMNLAFSMLSDFLNNKVPFKEIHYEPKLLIEGGTYYEQSVIYRNISSNFYPYIQGYINSADYLKNVIVENNRIEELFLPMCYLYRNGIELSLKRILFDDCKIEFNKASKIVRKKKHSIQGMWNSIMNLAKYELEHYSNAPDGDMTLVYVEEYIRQLHHVDETSDKFRYPIDKNLKPHFQNREKLDINNVSLFFKELFSFLDAVDGLLSQIREYEAEMEAEMRGNYIDYY